MIDKLGADLVTLDPQKAKEYGIDWRCCSEENK